jgi:hypothetical protein
MSLSSGKDPTQFFSVVGAPYVPESHAGDTDHPLRERSEVRQPETGVAGLWLVLYAVIIGVSYFSNGGAAKLIETAAVIVR